MFKLCPSGLGQWTLVMIVLIWSAGALGDNGQDPLPEPLTLDYALSLSTGGHPGNVIARNRLERARAERDLIEGNTGVQTSIRGRLRWIKLPSIAIDPTIDDHKLELLATKRLYDFGYSDANISAAKLSVESQKLLVEEQNAQQRLEIMQAFFNVILSDLAYARDNETMAVAFVMFSRIKDKNELGQVADVELLEAENVYHKARSVRYASDVGRRASRSRLANILNRPGQLSSNLVRPELLVTKRKLPEIESLQQQAILNNPHLLALRQQVESARQKLLAARARKKPVIDLELGAAEYSRKTRFSDILRGEIQFQMPLSSSGAIDAEIAKQRTIMLDAQAILHQYEMDLNQQVLELWQSITVFRAKRDEAAILSEYRDLALDKSRALYELDVKSDLGDSLALFSASLYQTARSDFDLAMAWAEMDATLGQPVGPGNKQTEPVSR